MRPSVRRVGVLAGLARFLLAVVEDRSVAGPRRGASW